MKKTILLMIVSLVVGWFIGHSIKPSSDSERFDNLAEHCSAAFGTQEKMLRNCGISFQTLNECYIVNPDSCNEEQTRNIIDEQGSDLKKLSSQLDKIYSETAKIIKN